MSGGVSKVSWMPFLLLKLYRIGLSLLMGFVLVPMLIGMVSLRSDMASAFVRLIPKFECMPVIHMVPDSGAFCMSETEAAVANLDFDENIVELHEGTRPYNFFGDEEEERKPATPEATPVPTPTPDVSDGGLPKCNRCPAQLVDRKGDRGIIYGDTLRVEYSGHEFKFRLWGVDAYEMGQQCGAPDNLRDCGAESRGALMGILSWSDWVYFTYDADGKYHKPSHDRFVVDVFVGEHDPYRVGESLVMDGYAVPSPDFLRGDEKDLLLGYHEDAKARSMGVYRPGEPEPADPRDYRRARRQ